jgi:hypothetical protein
MRSLLAAAFTFLILPAHGVAAQENGPILAALANVARSTALTASTAAEADAPPSQTPRHVAFEYSDGYKTRAKIHKYAAVATLPLFASEFYLGQSIYNTPSDSRKNAHIAIGTGIMGLYAVQTVTGVWNLVEGNRDPNGHKRRLIHGILMLASGAGFAVTPMTAPGERDFFEFGRRNASTHRAVALTSIGIGTAGYLMMLFGAK